MIVIGSTENITFREKNVVKNMLVILNAIIILNDIYNFLLRIENESQINLINILLK